MEFIRVTRQLKPGNERLTTAKILFTTNTNLDLKQDAMSVSS
jgi:hypothetical protein